MLFAALALLVAAVAWLDPRPSLRHVRATMLSGSPTGNYFATVERLADEVSRRKGRLANVATAGSVENIQRLTDARSSCEAHFALVQDGIDWPDKHGLALIGRLPRDETLVLLGRNADRIASTDDLKGLRLGIGPVGSGTEHMMRRVLAPLAGLELVAGRRGRAPAMRDAHAFVVPAQAGTQCLLLAPTRFVGDDTGFPLPRE